MADVNGEGDVDAAARLARGMEADIFRFKSLIGDVGQVIGARAWVAVVQRDFSAAIANLGSDSSDPSEHRAWLTARATIGVLAGDAGTLRAEAEEARLLPSVCL